jgi:SAM-dependent methyltransferase
MGRVDRLQDIEEYWSDQAATFDEEPDHGLADPRVRMAWAARLAEWIPPEAATVADLGCGTGSLSVLLAQAGLGMIGVDVSPAMVTQARAKAQTAGVTVEFFVGEASDPNLAGGSFDVVLSRHVVWTLADPIAALSRWARLLTRDGRLVLVEGRWFDPSPGSSGDRGLPWDGGVTAAELMAALSPHFGQIDHHPLSNDTALWGRTVTDERYAVVAHHSHQARITC